MRNGRSINWQFWLVVLTILIGMSLVIFCLLLATGKIGITIPIPEKVHVPDVWEMGMEEAVPILQEAGFDVVIRPVYDKRNVGTVVGTVFEEDPEERRGQEIKLYVSIGVYKNLPTSQAAKEKS